jgi:hypothetical protein
MRKTIYIAALLAALLGATVPGVAFAQDDHGHGHHSPGVVSGNQTQAPIHIPINQCDHAISVIGLLDQGDQCPS